MHQHERRQMIKAMLDERGVVRVAEVCQATGASEASIRRDFARLADSGFAARVHGGLEVATKPNQASPYTALTLATGSFDASHGVNVAAKQAIAEAAVELCEDGEAIIINGGTTTFEMGEFLCHRRLKVLTNSYPLAEKLIHHGICRVALPGGEVYRDQKLIVSPFEDDSIQHYSARRMFMSAISVGPLGVIEGDPLIARAEIKLLKRAEKLIVLADSSKFVARGSLVVCPLSRIDILITDRDAPPAAIEMLRASGIQTIVVDAEPATARRTRELAG